MSAFICFMTAVLALELLHFRERRELLGLLLGRESEKPEITRFGVRKKAADERRKRGSGLE